MARDGAGNDGAGFPRGAGTDRGKSGIHSVQRAVQLEGRNEETEGVEEVKL